jgi:protein involved in polysaccharide export with SLBB domain
MKRLLAIPLAILLLAGPVALYPQSPGGSQSGDAQQSPSANCTDQGADFGAGCTQDQTGQQSSQQNPRQNQQYPIDQNGIENRRMLGATGMDNTTLLGPGGVQGQLQRRVLPPEPPTEFQKFVAASIGQLLPIYGANLFRDVPSTFAPSNLAPATSDYTIGPEDELRVRIWGQINYSGNLRVDRSGNISLPQVGDVHVAGLQFSALDQHLRAAVGRVYRNFDLSVDIGRIRSMQIYVTGQSRSPGAYTVSSLSSLVDALFASGGPSAQGSLRHILLKRNGKVITDFDLYALLVHGDKSSDARLLPEDVIFIPPVGAQIAIAGSIRNPGIYEMRGGETIADLIDVAGKTTAVASHARVSLDREQQPQHRQAMEFTFDAGGLATPLADGDILRIYSILPVYEKTVTLRGFVANAGRFGWHPGMRLSELIPDRDSLVGRDYWWKRSHLGLPTPEFEPTISTMGRDQRTPETNTNGFTASVTPDTLTSALQPVDQREAANNNANQGETRSSGSIASQVTQVTTQGGAVRVRRNTEQLSTPEINWDYAAIERVDPETLKTSLIPFELGKLVIDHDASQDLLLQPGDTVTVFSQDDIRVPLERQTKYVELDGEFVHAGVYSVQQGETLRDLVRRAGGLTRNAYLYGSEFTRESTRVLQQQRLDEYVQNVNMEAQRGTQALAASGSGSGSSSSDVTASRTAGQDLVARLSQVRATGRIVLQFSPTKASVADVPAIKLENGDRFVVPFVPSVVNVVGAVYDQNSFLFEPAKTVKHFLQMAGGPDRDADRRHEFVIRADGSVISRAVVDKNYFTNGFNELRLNPGDTVVVPDKVLRPSAIRAFADWTQVFSQLALGAAAINVVK